MGSRAESEEDLQGVVTSSAQDEQVGRVQHAIETSLVAEDGVDAKAKAQSQVDAPTLATRDPSQVAETEMSSASATPAAALSQVEAGTSMPPMPAISMTPSSDPAQSLAMNVDAAPPAASVTTASTVTATSSPTTETVVTSAAPAALSQVETATSTAPMPTSTTSTTPPLDSAQSLTVDVGAGPPAAPETTTTPAMTTSSHATANGESGAAPAPPTTTTTTATTSKLRIVNPERLSGSESDENDSGSQQRNGSFPVPMYSPRMGDLNGSGSPRPVGLGSPRLTKVGSGSVSLIFTAPPTAGTSTAAKREAAAAKRAAKAQKPAPLASTQVQQRTALHEAILAGDEEAFDRLLVDLAIDEIDACEPKTGYSALMSASACEDGADAARLVAKLIERGAEIRTLDAEGFSAVHWAAAMGNCAAMEALLDAGADLDGQSESGDTALHRAARFGRDACIKSLVRDYGADVNVRNENDETALDAAGYLSPNKQIASRVRAAARKALFEADTRMKTLVVMHEECLGHRTAQAHQEAPERISAIHGKLKAGIDPECLQFCSAFEPATKALLRYAHNDKYIDLVFDLHQKVASLGRPVPFTPRVQVMNGLEENQLKDERHHAGVNGLLDNAVSCGFCIFNNVAIGAMHALTKYKSFIRRIAIVDFDVHHGNGTEEIVRTKFKRPEDILFFSIHLFDKAEDKAVGSGEFYPGSGGKDDPQCNVINSPIMPLWRVPTNRTRSKKRRLTDDDGPAAPQSKGAESKNGVDMSAPPPISDGSNGSHFSSPPLPTGPNYGRQAFRDHVNSRLVPALHRFDPDLIFISAGFDAGKNDVGCSRTENGKYWSGIDLGPDDYAFVTAEIQQVARACCQGRVVSLLEGGYGQWAREKTGTAGEPKKLVLNRDQLGENALAHVRALVDK